MADLLAVPTGKHLLHRVKNFQNKFEILWHKLSQLNKSNVGVFSFPRECFAGMNGGDAGRKTSLLAFHCHRKFAYSFLLPCRFLLYFRCLIHYFLDFQVCIGKLGNFPYVVFVNLIELLVNGRFQFLHGRQDLLDGRVAKKLNLLSFIFFPLI